MRKSENFIKKFENTEKPYSLRRDVVLIFVRSLRPAAAYVSPAFHSKIAIRLVFVYKPLTADFTSRQKAAPFRFLCRRYGILPKSLGVLFERYHRHRITLLSGAIILCPLSIVKLR